MRKKEITYNDALNRVKELSGIKVINENKKNILSTIEYTKKIGDKTFGIIKEGSFYFIKVANNEIITESDNFNYIGGLANKNDYKYHSYNDASKNLNIFGINICESLDKNIDERLEKDIAPEPDPGEPEPQNQEAPIQAQPNPEPQPEPVPDEVPAPAPNPEESPVQPEPEDDDSDLMDDEEDTSSEIDHYVGKLTNTLRNANENDLSEEKIKGIMNSIISALPLLKLSPEERLELAKRVKRGGKKKEDDNSQELTPEPSSVEPEASEEPVTETKIVKPFDVMNKKIDEGKYSWDQCEKDQEKEYGSKKIADKVCGAIKAGHIKEDMAATQMAIFTPEYINKLKNAGFEIKSDNIALLKSKSNPNKTIGSISFAKFDPENFRTDKIHAQFRAMTADENGKVNGDLSFETIDEAIQFVLHNSINEDYNKDDDKKINEFYSKLNKNNLIVENDKVKYNNIIIESKDKKISFDNGKQKYDFNVSKETLKKINYLLTEAKVKKVFL